MPNEPFRAFGDTSFFIRLLNDRDPLHSNARKYFEFLVKNEHVLMLSSIAIAEYCVRGKIDELPFSNVDIVSFNSFHAARARAFARHAFDSGVIVSERRIIPNDCNLFAQADIERASIFLTSDARSKNLFDLLQSKFGLAFRFVDIRSPVEAELGG